MRRFILAALLVSASVPAANAEPAAAKPDPMKDPAVQQLIKDLQSFNPQSDADFPKIVVLIDKFIAENKDSALLRDLKVTKLQLAQRSKSPEAQKALVALSEDSDKEIAEMAKGVLMQQEKIAELKTKPMELKFETSTGEQFDLSKLRGKVVLVDFWASWCGPCIQSLPSLVKYYEKMREKGIEVVGISLDQDKKSMDAAIEKLSVPWPQYFEGESENKISSQYGITTVPTLWVLDKEGKLHATGHHLSDVEAQIEELLKEG